MRVKRCLAYLFITKYINKNILLFSNNIFSSSFIGKKLKKKGNNNKNNILKQKIKNKFLNFNLFYIQLEKNLNEKKKL
jgi:hypothetical protein